MALALPLGFGLFFGYLFPTIQELSSSLGRVLPTFLRWVVHLQDGLIWGSWGLLAAAAGGLTFRRRLSARVRAWFVWAVAPALLAGTLLVMATFMVGLTDLLIIFPKVSSDVNDALEKRAYIIERAFVGDLYAADSVDAMLRWGDFDGGRRLVHLALEQAEQAARAGDLTGAEMRYREAEDAVATIYSHQGTSSIDSRLLWTQMIAASRARYGVGGSE